MKKYLEKNWFKLMIIILFIVFIVYNGPQRQNKSDVTQTSENLSSNIVPKKTGANPDVSATPTVKKVSTQSPTTINNNLDSTCLSFYEKMKALDIPVVKTIPTKTPAELKAIEDAYAGNYNPAIKDIWAKQAEADKLYTDTINGNIAQKIDLNIKYGFCYEYLSKTYGFIIN